MEPLFCLVVLIAVQAETPDATNGLFVAAVEKGLTAGGATVKPPSPTFVDRQSADEQRDALRKVAGSDRKAEEMLADSVTAPYILKLADHKVESATLRSIDLWFVLHVDLEAIKTDEFLKRGASEPVESGNMRFEAKTLTAADLKLDHREPPSPGEVYSHSTGRLLDRIHVESTDRFLATRTADSIVVAGGTDPRFGDDSRWPNRWTTISGAGKQPGPPQPYLGSVGYTKISRWKGRPGIVVIEAHTVLAEPYGWFEGAPILRSKFNLIAQDQVRKLRREMSKSARPR